MKIILFKIYLLLFFFTITNSLHAQSFEWAIKAGSYAFDFGYGVGSDDIGNVYVAGKYEMGKAYFGAQYVSCAGNHDFYLMKYNPAGEFQWVRTGGGLWGDYAHALSVDGAGNSYATGEFEVTSYFGADSLTTYGGNDIFTAKYNTDGVLQWIKRAGGRRSDKGLGISNFNGNVFVTGMFQDTAEMGGKYYNSSGLQDIFLAKYNGDGKLLWVKQAGGAKRDEGLAICNDALGNVYLTGDFSGTVDFNGTSLTSSGLSDIFIAKYTTDGLLAWVKRAGGSGTDYGYGIVAGDSGKIYVTGGFRNKSNFGSIQLKSASTNADIFIACYNSDGTALWVKKAGGGLSDYGRAIAVDKNSDLYITGQFGDTATFGNTTLVAADSADIFIASYTKTGDLRWVLHPEGNADKPDYDRPVESGLSICVDKSENVFASGDYCTDAVFGNTVLDGFNHTDIYLTKIKQQASIHPAYIFPSGPLRICSGDSAVLKANIGVDFSYQWKKDGINIPDVFSSFTTRDAGNYEVEVINNGVSVVSNSVKVIVDPLPVADAGLNVSVCKGSAATLKASGGTSYLWMPQNGLDATSASTVNADPLSTTTYKVKVIYGNCVATDSVEVMVIALPTAILGSDTLVCLGSGVELSALGEGTYSWAPPEGLSGNIISNPLASPKVTTTYTLTVTDKNVKTCKSTYTTQVTVLNCTGMEKNSFNADIKISPNPMINELYIETSLKKNAPVFLEIYDVLGQLILRRAMLNHSEIIYTEKFKNGVYFLLLKNEDGVYSERIIKIKD